MGQIDLLNPAGERSAQQPAMTTAALAPRLASLAGATVGIFSNAWQCMTTLADELRERLPRQYGVKEVIVYESPITAALPAAMLEEAAARCDAAIVGLGT